MNVHEILLSALTAAVVAGVGMAGLPLVMHGRILPLVTLGEVALGAASASDTRGLLAAYDKELQNRTVTLLFEGESQIFTLAELGASLDFEKTQQKAVSISLLQSLGRSPISPVVTVEDTVLYDTVHKRFGQRLQLPQDASLIVTTGLGLALKKSAPGERIDVISLAEELKAKAGTDRPIDLTIISAAADIQDEEVESARAFAQQLLIGGFVLTFEDSEMVIKPVSVRRMLTFVPQTDPGNAVNKILGVAFDEAELTAYLENTIAPEVNQAAVDARFEVQEGGSGPVAVQQFAEPQRGQEVDLAFTIKTVEEALVKHEPRSPLAVTVTEPDITSVADMERLGIRTLLAQGESNFAGSPANRVHNIRVGAGKYNGLLISPGEEFSFLKYLGPVTGEAGFKPELVIKSNVTVPEFGGGLCQVSTTAFRAALNSGLEITQRRNHSYAVSYYGTPGFDATIYPPYTDLRFLNNTPGYILVQTRIIGTRLLFDFWGTDDGRDVEIAGPTPYNRQPDGAVKATLTQVVTKDGQVLREDTFYSNYKSPKLFPKVLVANGEPVPPNATPTTPTPNPAPQNTKPPASQPN